MSEIERWVITRPDGSERRGHGPKGDAARQRRRLRKGEKFEIVESHTYSEPVVVIDLRAERNRLIDNYAWTVAAYSPLSDDSRAQWLIWFERMNRVIMDDVAQADWPPPPKLEYRT